MKIKLDENLPGRLVQALTDLGHDVDTVVLERLVGQDDHAVWQAAQRAGRFLITQDLDFSDVRRYTPGTHRGLLLVRLASPGGTALLSRVQSLFAVEDVSTWAGCLVVATDRKTAGTAARGPPAGTAGRRVNEPGPCPYPDSIAAARSTSAASSCSRRDRCASTTPSSDGSGTSNGAPMATAIVLNGRGTWVRSQLEADQWRSASM